MKILLAEDDGTLAGRLFHLLVKNGCQYLDLDACE